MDGRSEQIALANVLIAVDKETKSSLDRQEEVIVIEVENNADNENGIQLEDNVIANESIETVSAEVNILFI